MSTEPTPWARFRTQREPSVVPSRAATSCRPRRRRKRDDPASFGPYPGRLGFTDANGSPDPQDYNEHGGIYLHLARNGASFVNFGNGFEFAIGDEDGATEPTGIRQHVNVPMEKVVRDNSDHLFPEYNTHIPDAPLAEDPSRFSRFGRFQQVFEDRYVDRTRGDCKLPSYVDLYYPNAHGGGPFDINPQGPEWSYKRFVQDNDEAVGRTVELISIALAGGTRSSSWWRTTRRTASTTSTAIARSSSRSARG